MITTTEYNKQIQTLLNRAISGVNYGRESIKNGLFVVENNWPYIKTEQGYEELLKWITGFDKFVAGISEIRSQQSYLEDNYQEENDKDVVRKRFRMEEDLFIDDHNRTELTKKLNHMDNLYNYLYEIRKNISVLIMRWKEKSDSSL